MNKIDVLVKYFGPPKMTDRNGNSYFHCPFCHHHNNKLTINVEKGVYNCYHCEVRGKSLVYLLKRINAPNPNQYKSIFNEEAKRNIEDIDNLFGKELAKEKKLILPKGYENLFRSIEKAFYKPAVEYLLKRGMSKEDILKYDIHYSVNEQRILFPSYDRDNNLNYYVARSIQSFEKYK